MHDEMEEVRYETHTILWVFLSGFFFYFFEH